MAANGPSATPQGPPTGAGYVSGAVSVKGQPEGRSSIPHCSIVPRLTGQARSAIMLNVLDRYRDAGLLLLRVGIGLSYMGYGAPKLSGGPPMWEELGQAMRYLGITFAPAVWGSWPR